LFRSLPDVEDELGPLKKAKHDPRTADYWTIDEASQWSAQLTHRIKTLYGFFHPLRFIEQPEQRKAAQERLLYLSLTYGATNTQQGSLAMHYSARRKGFAQ
jgi:hypothetical protein